MDIQLEYDPYWTVGDVIQVEGKNYRITKKTKTAIAVERYYFWHLWWDFWFGEEIV